MWASVPDASVVGVSIEVVVGSSPPVVVVVGSGFVVVGSGVVVVGAPVVVVAASVVVVVLATPEPSYGVTK